VKTDILIIDLLFIYKRNTLYIYRKKWHVLGIAILFGLIGAVFFMLQKPKYEAVLTLIAENTKTSRLPTFASSLASQFGFDMGVDGNNAFEGANLLELFKSDKIIGKTLTSSSSTSSAMLIEIYLKNHGYAASLRKSFENRIKTNALLKGSIRFVDSVIAHVSDEVISHLIIKKLDDKIDIISIRLDDYDEVFAKEFVEKLVDNTVKLYTEYRTTKNAINVNILSMQVDSLKNILAGSIDKSAIENDLNINPAKQAVKTKAQKEQINFQATSTLYVEMVKNLAFAKLALLKEAPLIQLIDTPKMPLKNKKISPIIGGSVFFIMGAALTIFFLLLQRQKGHRPHRSVVFSKHNVG
jgi:hypothetical protein